MGCCCSKSSENEDMKFEPNTDLIQIHAQPGECEYEEPRKARQWVERIETNKDSIVMSVDPEAPDEKIAKDREETLMEHGKRFLLE